MTPTPEAMLLGQAARVVAAAREVIKEWHTHSPSRRKVREATDRLEVEVNTWSQLTKSYGNQAGTELRGPFV